MAAGKDQVVAAFMRKVREEWNGMVSWTRGDLHIQFSSSSLFCVWL